MTRRLRLRKTHGYALLANADDYDRWNQSAQAEVARPPREYPCLVREEFRADTQTEYGYIYPAYLCDMIAVLISCRRRYK